MTWCFLTLSDLTFILQTPLSVGLALRLAVALLAFVLQQGFLPLQLPQNRLEALPAAHLKSNHWAPSSTRPAGLASQRQDSITLYFTRSGS